MDFLEILKNALNLVAGIVIALIAAASQWRNLTPKSRTALKHDLDILKLIDPSEGSYKILKEHIDETIRKTYSHNPQQSFFSRVRSKLTIFLDKDFYVGAGIIFSFSALTLYLLKDGFTWGALPTGFIALTGIGGILNALKKIE